MRGSRLGWLLRALGLLFALFVLAVAEPARADDAGFGDDSDARQKPASISGLELDLSTGYTLPVGRFEPGERVSASTSALFPLAAEIGYRINAEWFVGVHGLYAFAANSQTPNEACPDCSHNLFRLGLFGEFRLPVSPTLRLAFGLGTGPQFFNTTIDQSLQKSRSFSGWQLFEARIGSQWLATDGMALGPFVGASVGMFSTERTRCLATKRTASGACSTAERDVERRLHGGGLQLWWTIGLRAVILP
jgi:hypothetical protein